MEQYKMDDNITATKRKINELDNQIDDEKRKIKKIDDIQENITSLNKNMNRCIELLSKSIIGPNTKNIFDDMNDSNRLFYRKTATALDEEIEISQKKISMLSTEKDKVIKESKNKTE